MNKLNALGVELLAYKEEFNKENYPEVVRKSLNQSVDHLLSTGIIDIDIHLAIKDKTSKPDFERYILTKPTCLKTIEQLFEEYEELRETLNNALEEEGVSNNVGTTSYVNKEKVMITKAFLIDVDYVKEYFGVDEEEDIEKLMKRKGFVERFAVLRLPKIFKSFIESHNIDSEFFVSSISETFYDSDKNSYGIYLLFDIPIENLEEEDNIPQIVEGVKRIIDEAEDDYASKMQI